MPEQPTATAPAESPSDSLPTFTRAQRLRAWAVHMFTMSGLAWATLALLALLEGHTHLMWLWLAVSLVVDGVDGTWARRARVKEVVPWFDGGVLDIVVDYLTWTFIPAIFMYLQVPLGPDLMAGALMMFILCSSMFCYANNGWKSVDNYFVGFPAAWNVVAVMMWGLGTPMLVNVIITVVMGLLTLTPTYYAHPARILRGRALLVAATVAWFAGTTWLVAVHPARPIGAVALVLVGGGWFLVVCAVRTIKNRPDVAG